MRSRQTSEGVGSGRPAVVALSAAEGLEFGRALVDTLARLGVDVHLVIGRDAAAALGDDADALRALGAQTYAESNQAARISSGSFLNRGMVVAPCDRGSVAAIVLGLATNLVYRAADVTLKERRPLVLGVPAAALERVPPDIRERAAAVPGLSLVPLAEPVEDAVGALLAELGIGRASAV